MSVPITVKHNACALSQILKRWSFTPTLHMCSTPWHWSDLPIFTALREISSIVKYEDEETEVQEAEHPIKVEDDDKGKAAERDDNDTV